MRAAYDDEDPIDRPVMRFIRRNLALLVFLALSSAAMLAAYFYFSPVSGVAEVVAAGSSAETLSAKFVKPVPARPVVGRVAQSPGPVRIGIIAGHKGNDSGAVCADGLTEAEVVENIAVRVVSALQTRGIAVDLLTEFDPRLDGYVGTALVSIHADSCDYFNEQATGFKVAGSGYTDSSALSICAEDAYRQATQHDRLPGVPPDRCRRSGHHHRGWFPEPRSGIADPATRSRGRRNHRRPVVLSRPDSGRRIQRVVGRRSSRWRLISTGANRHRQACDAR